MLAPRVEMAAEAIAGFVEPFVSKDTDCWAIVTSPMDSTTKAKTVRSLAADAHERLSLVRGTAEEAILRSRFRAAQLSLVYLCPDDPAQCLEAVDMAIIVAGPDADLLFLADLLEGCSSVASGEPDAFARFVPRPPPDLPQTRPLGVHQPTYKGSLGPEILHRPTYEEFLGHLGAPFLIASAMTRWPALTKWQCPGYLAAAAGHRLVPIEIGSDYLAQGWAQKIVPLGVFLEMGLREGQAVYMAQYDLLAAVPRLQSDLDDLDYADLINPEASVQRNLWIGASGSFTPMHADPYHNLFCQIVGSKRIRLSSAEQPRAGGPAAGAIAFDCMLEPGQMLFIPKGWWHEVTGYSFNVSLSHWVP